MKRAITITGWQRPELFRALLKSLAANDLRGWDIFVQLEPSDSLDEFRAAAAESLCEVPLSITVNAQRLGIRENPYSLLSRVFDDGADLVLYLEEDLLLAPDATALARWYAENHRPEWMCLSLLSGGCGSKGFISDRNHPEILFTGKSFNSLGFAVLRDEWERYLRSAWLADEPVYNHHGQAARGWDWSVYLRLITTPGLYTLQPATARATHTGRYGTYCKPEFHDAAFTGLDLADGAGADGDYRLLATEAMPALLRRQVSLWDQANSALRVINEGMSHIQSLLSEKEAQLLKLRNLLDPANYAVTDKSFVLWGFRMFLGRDPDLEGYNLWLSMRCEEFIDKLRSSAEFQSSLTQTQAPNPPTLPVDSMPNSREAITWAYVLLLRRKPEDQTVVENYSQRATVGDIRRIILRSDEYKIRFLNKPESR